jgi:hypothetical protein
MADKSIDEMEKEYKELDKKSKEIRNKLSKIRLLRKNLSRQKILIIEKFDDGKLYLSIGSKRRRYISKTELRMKVGEFIRDLNET